MTGSTKTFKDLELAGWSGNAGNYDAFAGAVTWQVAKPLLKSAGVASGTKVLEVACGPGYCTAAAAELGAQAVGVDFARPMVEEASRRYPDLRFEEGDAESLSFDSESFDAVVCPFGLLHIERPETAVSEAWRVLKSDGRYSFSVWCSPDKFRYYALVLEAIRAHAEMNLNLPPAPDMFRFSDHDECRAILKDAGFVDPEVSEVHLIWRPAAEEAFVEMIYKSTVRARMVIERQGEDVRQRINREVLAGAAEFRKGDGYEVPWPAVIASGRRP